jgi:hypothetical protein
MTFWLGTNHTVFQEGIFFQQGRVGHLGWRLCRIALRGAADPPNASLALRRSDAGRAWAYGNDSRSIDYGHPNLSGF